MENTGRTAEARSASPAPDEGAWRRRLAALLLGAFFFLSLLEFPAYVASTELDPSWAQALGHLYKTRAQAGIDYIFTFGPLGTFTTSAYDTDLFWQKFAWEIALKAMLAALLVCTILSLRSRAEQIGAALLCCAAPLYVEAIYLFGMYAVLRDVVLDAKLPAWSIVWRCAFVALLSCTKFNLMLYALAGGAAVVGALLLEKNFRSVALLVESVVLAFCVIWAASGQSLANIPEYFRTSLELSSGYTEAMSIWPSRFGRRMQIVLAALIIVSLAASHLISLWGAADRKRQLGAATLTLLAAFMLWKHGFVRQDNHEARFFSFMLVAPFLCWSGETTNVRTRRIRAALAFTPALMAFIGFLPMDFTPLKDPSYVLTRLSGLRQNLGMLLKPYALRESLEKQRSVLLEKNALPNVKAYVGSASIDSLSDFQGVLLLNGFNWTPRPVMQSHATVRPSLLDANAAYFRGPRAPEFLLLHLRAIDERFVATEDGAVLLEILTRYRPHMIEGDYLLLQRQKSATPPVPKLLAEKELRLGEPFNMTSYAGKIVFARVDAGYSAYGKLFQFLFRAPEMWLEVSGATTSRSWRVVPAMLSSGFLLQPALENHSFLLPVYQHDHSNDLKSITLRGRPNWQRHFNSSVRVRLFEIPREAIVTIENPDLLNYRH